MTGFWHGSGISWTICKQSAPRSRQITTPTPHHLSFYRPDALPDTQPSVEALKAIKLLKIVGPTTTSCLKIIGNLTKTEKL